MKKEFFNEVTVSAKGSCEQVLKYYLLTGCVSEEYCDLMVYGVEIDREVRCNGKKQERDKKVIPDLFFVREEAEEFLQKISEEKVTPTELKYAVREYISEKLRAKNLPVT